MICIGEWMVVGGELKGNGTDGEREMHWKN